MNTFNNVAFIFARSGSKGSLKNILPFNGKPLIAWSIIRSLESEYISQVYVSTDCPEIASIAKDYGALVPSLRPAHLATDSSPEILSWQHSLSEYLSLNSSYPDSFISVPCNTHISPTSCLRP